MIVGIGSDIIEIERIACSCQRLGTRFLRRVLSERECQMAMELKPARQAEFVAGRFAVKEAMAKASGVGLGRLEMGHLDVQVGPTGLSVTVDEAFRDVRIRSGRWHVSISHTATMAFAIAVLEQD